MASIPQIAMVLNRVPREMLLVLKTNDLLRGLEAMLGTKDERRSLITMSRYCVVSVYEEQLRLSSGWVQSLQTRLARQWALTRLSVYQIYLWVSCLAFGPSYA